MVEDSADSRSVHDDEEGDIVETLRYCALCILLCDDDDDAMKRQRKQR